MKTDFELELRRTDKRLLGHHEIPGLIKTADSVTFYYGTQGDAGFSDTDYSLAKVVTGTDSKYFINTNGQYHPVQSDVSMLENAAFDYRTVNRNTSLEKVLESAPKLLGNDDANSYLTCVVGDLRDDELLTKDVDFYDGQMDGNQYFNLVVLNVVPMEADKKYFASFNGSDFVEVNEVEGQSMISIATRSLVPYSGIKYFEPRTVKPGRMDNEKTPIGVP